MIEQMEYEEAAAEELSMYLQRVLPDLTEYNHNLILSFALTLANKGDLSPESYLDFVTRIVKAAE